MSRVLRSSRRSGLHRALFAATLCTVLTGCMAGGPSRSSTHTAGGTATIGTALPSGAEDANRHFHLVFELPKSIWKANEAITGQAVLSLVGASSMTVSGSGSGIVGFEFAEIGGDRKVSWVVQADCEPRRLDAASPIVSPLAKTAGYGSDAPQNDFYRSFATDPLIRLPAGDWTITAVTWFAESLDCTGVIDQLSAPVSIHVQS